MIGAWELLHRLSHERKIVKKEFDELMIRDVVLGLKIAESVVREMMREQKENGEKK